MMMQSCRFLLTRPQAQAPETATGSAPLGSLPEWNLNDLYPGMESPEFIADINLMVRECESFSADFKGKLGALAGAPQASEKLFEIVKRYEVIDDRMGRIMSYASLVYAGDTTDPKRAKFYGDVHEKVTKASGDLLFFALELNRIDDALIDRAVASGPLAHYRPWVEDLRKDKPYQLDDRTEQLFLDKSVTAYSAWNRLFDETIAALRFDVGGESLAIEPTLNKLLDADGTVRKSAADALAVTFKENLRTFGLITNVLAKDKEISDRWRNFADVADSRHLANRIERDVVEALVSAVREAYPRLSHRYYKLKASWFGKEQLDYWDRNAPLPKVRQRVIPWAEARDTVLAACHDFSPKMAETGRKFFDGNWIDAPTRPGKAPGAFAHPTVPSAHPYLLVNYQGKTRDVMTLAHELGHGIHQVMAAPNGALMAPTPLTLAETASVFAEMLTFRRLLGQTIDVAERKAMLAQKVEDMLNTVVRQIAFYTFERKVHESRRNGELTLEEINGFWMDVQRESLGPSIRLDEGYETFWCYVPHFIHSPFYVYAYAFGDCLVNSLYGVYEKSSDSFAERYFALLSAGGTKHHSELLAPFGLDARDPSFWTIGLSMIERLIGEIEELERAV